MKVLLDTNVIIDHAANREPFAQQAFQVMDLCASGRITGMMTASTVTDIYYILKKTHTHQQIIDKLRLLFTVLKVVGVGKYDLLAAMNADFSDFEDALVAQCAAKADADYIVTRNTKDFALSPVPALAPDAFLGRMAP